MSDTAYIKSQKSISKIWIIPLLTTLLGMWMIYDYLHSRGQLIYITMPNAKGIVVGQTEIKTRSVPIGTVSDIRLSEDTQNAIVAARINSNYVDLLTEDAQIWSVEPRIDESGISGLNTLFSGVYLEFAPGNSDNTTDQFTLLPEPPLLSRDVKGKRYRLNSKSAEVLEVGTPIYFQNYRVGQIETAEFDLSSESMRYQIFIESPYNELVLENSLFWVDSGVDLDISAAGVNLNTSNLSKILRGGIAFGLPEREIRGDTAIENREFTLSANYKESLDDRYAEFSYYVVTTNESIRGLFAGAPVEFRGIRIGTVVEAPAILSDKQGNPDTLPYIFSGTKEDEIALLIKIEYRRISQNVDAAQTYWQQNIDKWIQRGLGASLETGNLLTGALFISLDFHERKIKNEKQTIAGYPVIPSVSGGIKQFSTQISALLDKLNKLDVESTLSQTNRTLHSVSALAKETQQLIASEGTKRIPETLNKSMAQLQRTLQDFEKNSPLYKDLQETLLALQTISEDLQPFAKTINENPNSLLFDSKARPDIEPRKSR